jgi:crotonobetainyl-CoA:carnitine CoA-transferase CaiB-like acyl-CoA transferase
MPALEGLRVIDLATVFAGPGAARHLADFGADVVKVEPPAGDGVRRMGWFPPEGGDSYTWKLLGRNKRAVVADLKSDAGRALFTDLVDRADVLIENFRPGTLERLGFGPDVLASRNPRLVVLRVTGFGQDGPYASRPGFATMAEAMSGFAAINGEPDGPPLLPPIALTDEVAAIAGAFAVMVALRDRDRTGLGQVIDVNLLESMLQMMSALPSAAAHLGYDQPRLGSGIPYSVPRGTYRCADNRWVAISTSAESVAHRVLVLLGLGDDPRFDTFESRAEHRAELDAAVTTWVGHRASSEVLAAFQEAEAAIAPVYTMTEVLADPHVRARAVFVEVDGIVMQGPAARLARTPAEMRWAGRALGSDTDSVLDELERDRGSGRRAQPS